MTTHPPRAVPQRPPTATIARSVAREDCPSTGGGSSSRQDPPATPAPRLTPPAPAPPPPGPRGPGEQVAQGQRRKPAQVEDAAAEALGLESPGRAQAHGHAVAE